MSRPRPVELAVAFDDGPGVSTVVNPQRDLADAREAYGITASDVLVAPTLLEAWAVIAPMLAGCTPVGVGIDETLGLIDFELKRLGYVTAMPLGLEVSGPSSAAPTALARARSALQAHARSGVDDGAASAFDEPEPAESVSGLLVSRDSDVRTPGPTICRPCRRCCASAAMSARSCCAGRPPQEVPRTSETPWIAAARQSVADQLRAAASRARLTDVAAARLREASKMLGVDVVSGACVLERHDIGAVLVPGARICFTGTARDAAGRVVRTRRDGAAGADSGSGAGQVGDQDPMRGTGDRGGGRPVRKGAQGSGVREASVLSRRLLRLARKSRGWSTGMSRT